MMFIKSIWQAMEDVRQEYKLIFREDVPAHLHTELMSLSNDLSGTRMSKRDYDTLLVNICGQLNGYV